MPTPGDLPPQSKPYAFPKSARLLKRRDFLSLMHKGHTFYGNFVIFQWKKNHLKKVRLGIIITKKFGASTERNRFKRLVREGFRLSSKPELGLDITVRPRKNFNQLTLADLMCDFEKCFSSFKPKNGS